MNMETMAMEITSTERQVLNYLGELGKLKGEERRPTTDKGHRLMAILKSLDKSKKDGNSSVAQEISAVQDWISRPVKAEYRRRFEEIEAPVLSDSSGELSEAATTLLAVGYLKANEIMSSPSAFNRLKKRIKQNDGREGFSQAFADKLASLNSDFIGELLIETRQRAATNADFARELAGAVEEVKQLGDDLRRKGIVVPGIREQKSEDPKPMGGWWFGFTVVCTSWVLFVCIAAAVVIVAIWIWFL